MRRLDPYVLRKVDPRAAAGIARLQPDGDGLRQPVEPDDPQVERQVGKVLIALLDEAVCPVVVWLEQAHLFDGPRGGHDVADSAAVGQV